MKETIGDATFYHINDGLEKGIRLQLDSGIMFPDNVIKLEFNIDGIPIFKSPVVGFWPILCRVIGTKDLEPFLVSVFCGPGKPGNVSSFLNPAIDDVLRLEKDGFVHNGKRFEVKLHRVVCDTPARSFVKATKGHNAYYACERCCQRGRYLRGRVTFPRIRNVQLRNNLSFRSKSNPPHHTGLSPFLRMTNLDMVFSFPLDYMHLVLLGVMKRLLKIWTQDLVRSPHRINDTQKERINKTLLSIRKHLPSEFERRSRSLKDVGTWKAVEYRTFLLYTGDFKNFKKIIIVR